MVLTQHNASIYIVRKPVKYSSSLSSMMDDLLTGAKRGDSKQQTIPGKVHSFIAYFVFKDICLAGKSCQLVPNI